MRPFATPKRNFLVRSPITILSSVAVSDGLSLVWIASFASFDATIRSAAFLESASIKALSSWRGTITKDAFSNWDLDLVLPPWVSRASNSSMEEQLRMAESEGALNLTGSTILE